MTGNVLSGQRGGGRLACLSADRRFFSGGHGHGQPVPAAAFGIGKGEIGGSQGVLNIGFADVSSAQAGAERGAQPALRRAFAGLGEPIADLFRQQCRFPDRNAAVKDGKEGPV